MPMSDHPSFDRPPVTTRLWRYTDMAKFIELLTSGTLWLTNAEVLARDDPHEGLTGAVLFPHRMWRSIEEVPEMLRRQILAKRSRGPDLSPETAFRNWFMLEEQGCIMTLTGRREYYVNCWHAAPNESAAMWKVYGAPGAGIAVITNGGRLESALSANTEDLNLGAVRYRDPSAFDIGRSNAFDAIMAKRDNYAFENEVRLVHWHTGRSHDALANFSWNEERMRFDDLIEDPRPLQPGMALQCEIEVLVERVVISPFAPPWYGQMIERLRDKLGYQFPVHASKLLAGPLEVP